MLLCRVRRRLPGASPASPFRISFISTTVCCNRFALLRGASNRLMAGGLAARLAVQRRAAVCDCRINRREAALQSGHRSRRHACVAALHQLLQLSDGLFVFRLCAFHRFFHRFDGGNFSSVAAGVGGDRNRSSAVRRRDRLHRERGEQHAASEAEPLPRIGTRSSGAWTARSGERLRVCHLPARITAASQPHVRRRIDGPELTRGITHQTEIVGDAPARVARQEMRADFTGARGIQVPIDVATQLWMNLIATAHGLLPPPFAGRRSSLARRETRASRRRIRALCSWDFDGHPEIPNAIPSFPVLDPSTSYGHLATSGRQISQRPFEIDAVDHAEDGTLCRLRADAPYRRRSSPWPARVRLARLRR